MNNDLISRSALKEDITLLTAYRYEPLSMEDIIDIIDNEVTKMDNDLISRSALKEEFLKYKPYAVDFLSLIDNAPTVELNEMTQDLIDKVNVNVGLAQPIKNERPQGEWITIDAFVVKCSVCGVESFATPFCPRCGAKMQKGGTE